MKVLLLLMVTFLSLHTPNASAGNRGWKRLARSWDRIEHQQQLARYQESLQRRLSGLLHYDRSPEADTLRAAKRFLTTAIRLRTLANACGTLSAAAALTATHPWTWLGLEAASQASAGLSPTQVAIGAIGAVGAALFCAGPRAADQWRAMSVSYAREADVDISPALAAWAQDILLRWPTIKSDLKSHAVQPLSGDEPLPSSRRSSRH